MVSKLSANVEVRTTDSNLTDGDVKFASEKVTGWKENGYSTMAILYFLSEYYSVGGFRENGKFVLNISKA